MKFFNSDNRTALEAIEYAQHIAFAPIVFQASIALRDLGILTIIEKQGKDGITTEQVVELSGLKPYGVRVLLEAGLGIGLLTIDDNYNYFLTKTGYFILQDEMTKVNMDFVQDICYKGMFDLTGSIQTGKPEGLKTLGPWPTVYEGLSVLPEKEQKSWFNFDHYYSSDSFPLVLPHVFKDSPKKLLDIGGNTGKWSLQCAKYNEQVQVTIADLPGQLKMAQANIESQGLSSRVGFHEINILDKNAKLPKGFDVIWMSQFLDCFSEEEIISILERCFEALDENGQVFILEPFWDRQKYKVSAFCLQMTSLYFTNIANGNSQMYHSGLFIKLVEKAGFHVIEKIDNIGVSHSLLKCSKKK
ncbi:MAG: class I SAM-dependent methyltransferase [Bacteroidetes bacterium]|nr:class I SAM-dependent methyltransferase [Bacteroidota bacterium]HET6244610.1 class I SAM-dependent methyltransferase [Bacteroidia bacterium]